MTNNDNLYRYNNELFEAALNEAALNEAALNEAALNEAALNEAAMNIVKQLLSSKKVGWLITIIGMYLTGFPPENKKQQGNAK